MKYSRVLALVVLLPCLAFLDCGSDDAESPEIPLLRLDPPGIHASGYPDEVPHDLPYLACDFSVPCATNSGYCVLLGPTNIPCTRTWSVSGERLYLTVGLLPPGRYTLSLGGFLSTHAQEFKEYTGSFSVRIRQPGNDTTPPVLVSQTPADQDFSVQPSLARIVLRFDEPVDTTALEYSLSDGVKNLRCTIDTSMRMTDLVICTLDEPLTPETCYVFSLYSIADPAGNARPVHVLLFATASSGGTQGHLAEGLVEHPVLSEVCVAGYSAGGASDEFIELYNPGMTPLDLAAGGYRVYKASATGSPELICDFANANHFSRLASPTRIPAQGFFLIANQASGTALAEIADGLVLKSRMSLAANNTVWLTRGGVPSESTSIDCIGMGQATRYEGPLPAAQPASGASLERKARQDSDPASMGSGGRDEMRGHALDRNRNSDDWVLRSLPQPQGTDSGYEDWTR
ncbi:MAG TPA: Ig-like domain-containing protein [Spirochaetota bacterium]|nr:Ig-like domain-containing protein [Spirochaetota bacterium]